MSDNDSNEISRRDALKLLGVVPLTGAMHWTPDAVARATQLLQQNDARPVQTAHKFFTAHENATVRILVDMIIPRDERSGSATDALVPEFMDYMLGEATERNQVEMRGGLAWIDTQCRIRFGSDFVKCTDKQRTDLLDDIAWPRRAPAGLSQGVEFFNSFRDLTASGFFSSQIGWKDLQYMGNVFNPNWNGCPTEVLRQLGVEDYS